MDAVEEWEVRAARVKQRGTGEEQYPPAMMLGLLVYCSASEVFSSRVIERMTYENVAVRVLCAERHPDHDTILRNNGKLLAKGFAQVLEMAARCGVLKVGRGDGGHRRDEASGQREQTCGELRARRRADEGVGGGDRGVACEGGGCHSAPLKMG